jgi:hypothetical protein
MKTIPSLKVFKLATFALAIATAWGLSVPSAQAVPVPYVVTLQQVGSNVVATGAGAIDLTGLSFLGSVANTPGIDPQLSVILTGAAGNIDEYMPSVALSGPASFGSGPTSNANSGTGDLVGITFSSEIFVPSEVWVPQGYVSGSLVSDTATYNNATFGSLGVTPGTYKWTWGTGVNQNFTLDIPAPTVPDTGSTLGLLLLALTALFGANCLRSFGLA